MAAGERDRRRVQQIVMSAREAHEGLRAEYGLNGDDVIEKDIRQAFLDGLHADISSQVLAYLERKYGAQSQIAATLGVDRSTVSKMKQNGRVGGQYLALAIARYGFAPQSDVAIRSGLIAAAYHIRKTVMRDVTCTQPMSIDEFTELACGHNSEWYQPFLLAALELEDFVMGDHS